MSHIENDVRHPNINASAHLLGVGTNFNASENSAIRCLSSSHPIFVQ